ncbi:hypothetical protein J7643_11650 [bacterium]|nr:hypothetical protein [bacterium]
MDRYRSRAPGALMILVAIVLITAPIIMAAWDTPGVFWSDVIIGLIVTGLAVWRLMEGPPLLSWITGLLGVFLLFLPLISDLPARSLLGALNTLCGLAIAGLSAWSLFQPFEEHPTGEPIFKSAADPLGEKRKKRLPKL